MAATWPWANPFARHSCSDADQQQPPVIREVWGTRFEWTPLHLSPEQLHPMKFTYDVLGDECLNRLDVISPPAHSGVVPRNQTRDAASSEKREAPPRRDLYVLLKENAEKDEKLGELWKEVTNVPDWVDWDQIERGQEIFYRYGGPALTAVCFHVGVIY